MKYKSLVFLVLFIAFCSVKPVYAMTIDGYKEYKINHPAAAKIYISGVGQGYSWYSSMLIGRGRKVLYCVPKKLVLNMDNYISILEEEIENFTGLPLFEDMQQEMHIELLLLCGLVRTCPCPESEREPLEIPPLK